MSYIQESVAFNSGGNFFPIRMRLRLPEQKSDVSIFLLSDSFEYDIELIKNMPAPKHDYRNIVIPQRLMDKIGTRPFRYYMTANEYNKKLMYLTDKKLLPQLNPVRYPYPSKIKDNVYISMSDLFKAVTPHLRSLSRVYIQEHIFDIFLRLTKNFNFSSKKVLIIDTKRFPIYQNPNMKTFNTDIINALLAAYLFCTDSQVKRLDWIIIFRSPEADYKLDLAIFDRKRDAQKLRILLSRFGIPLEMSAKTNDEAEDSVDRFESTSLDDEHNNDGDILEPVEIDPDEDDNLASHDTNPIADPQIKAMQKSNTSVISSIKSSISSLKDRYASSNVQNPEEVKDDTIKPSKLYSAKALNINAELINRITTSDDVVNNYRRLADEASDGTDANNDPVEKKLIDDASKKLAGKVDVADPLSVSNTTTSPRELKIRAQVGQLKLNNVTFEKLTSISDVPFQKAKTPNNITTTNEGVRKGTSFAYVAKEYEDKLLDRDIVATFMNLAELPNGFYVTGVEVTDVSTVTTLVNNWRVKLKSKETDRQFVINIRVPKLFNGRFYNNGIWYNIGKQDFPIPILKISNKKVILTSNYNKITVNRYDTRSLVDLTAMVKLLNATLNDRGLPKYTKPGSSSATNSHFVSTVEYDEYARRWISYINEESKTEIYFNRQTCAKLYSFVTVSENEFCCGMINKVPVVVNTETGLTRNGVTLTDTIFQTLPSESQTAFKRIKPGKMSMYSEITIRETMPLGVAIAAWEGLGSLVKRVGCKYQYVDKSFADPKFIVLPFKDRCLAIENTIQNQLIFNGFYRINTKAYNISDFETPIMNSNSVFVDIFNQLFFKQYSSLTTFVANYNFFVDVITKDVCKHYNLPDDICGMLIYASNLLADNNFTGEMNSALYRVRSSEIIPAIIHYHLAVAISKFNNAAGSKSRTNTIPFNPNEVINELLSVPNVSPMSALNPVRELHEREDIQKKGFRGVNVERAYTLEKRSYEDSMIGKMAMSSPNSANIGVNRQLTADPKIESVRGYTSPSGPDAEYDDLQLASFSELLTPGTVTRDDAIRTAIACSQSSHIIAVDDAQPALVSNGADEIVPAYLTDNFSVVAEDDGSVLEISDGYMIVQYKNGNKQAINVGDKYADTVNGFYVDNKLTPNFKAGDKFKKNDILAYHEKFMTKDCDGVVRFNIGPLAKVAFIGVYSTYEDAGLITAKMSKRCATRITAKEIVKINAMDDIDSVIKVGDEVEIGDPLVVFGLGDTGDKAVDDFLKAFQSSKDGSNSLLDNAKRVIKAKHAGKVVDVKMYTIKSLDRLSPSLFDLFDNYFKENRMKRRILDKYDKSNSVYKLGTLCDLPIEPLKGSSIKGITCDVLIEIYIEHDDEASVGDKLAVYAASKQVLSEVVPEGLEPYAESRPDEEISIFVAPASVLKRMIPSVVVTASANKVLIELKRKIQRIWEGKE